MARALVVLSPTSYHAPDFVAAADALGVELALAGPEEPPLGMEDRFVRIDCSRPDDAAARIADLAAHTPIDAVVAADDEGVVIASRAAALVGLAHNPPPAAAATRNKAELRRLLDTAEVPQPAWRPLGPEGTVSGLEYPLVVKPVSLSASRGVIRVDNPGELTAAAARARRIASAADLVVEEFVPGPEVSVEGLVWEGELEVLAVFDKPDPLDGPFFEETMFVTPSRHPTRVLAAVEDVCRRGVAALGLRHGPVHAEVRIGPRGPVLIEVAARTIGGLCGRALRFGLMGTSLEVMVLRQALGLRKKGLARERSSSGVLMLGIPARGTLVSLDGIEEAAAVPGVTGIERSIPLGSEVVPLPEGDRYLGFVFARADHPDEVEAALRRAGGLIRPVIAPDG